MSISSQLHIYRADYQIDWQLEFLHNEEQTYELFSKCADASEGRGIKRVIMGLDRNTE